VKDKLAHLLSTVFHPLIMPTWLFLLIQGFASNALQPISTGSRLRLLGLIFLMTVVIPGLTLAMLRVSSVINDINLERRRERLMPFLLAIFFYGLTAWLFYEKLHLNNLIFLVFAGLTALLAILAFITLFWKVSVHSAAAGGLAGAVAVMQMKVPDNDLFYPMTAAIVIAGAVMSSRLRLNVHTPGQVYTGVLVGFAVCFATLYLFY
jgi:membrane-associated phospholipid phosphatase